jgi:hypothetical protein
LLLPLSHIMLREPLFISRKYLQPDRRDSLDAQNTPSERHDLTDIRGVQLIV